MFHDDFGVHSQGKGNGDDGTAAGLSGEAVVDNSEQSAAVPSRIYDQFHHNPAAVQVYDGSAPARKPASPFRCGGALRVHFAFSGAADFGGGFYAEIRPASFRNGAYDADRASFRDNFPLREHAGHPAVPVAPDSGEMVYNNSEENHDSGSWVPLYNKGILHIGRHDFLPDDLEREEIPRKTLTDPDVSSRVFVALL